MNAAPPPSDQPVTLANWRTPPFNRRGLQRMREVLPTAGVENDPDRVWHLPRRIEDLGAVAFTMADGKSRTLDGWLQESYADGFLVLHRGQLVYERYLTGMTPERRHLVFSVTKSITALLVGILADQGRLDPEAPILDCIPEAAGTGFGDATVRQALDMQTSLDYDEDFNAPAEMLLRYREAVGWSPPRDPAQPGDLHSFLLSIGRRAGPHGKRFRYLTPNTDLLGWVCERATGEPFSALLSQHFWRPLGAERSADMSLDRLGAARAGGGLAMTLRDLGRVGELVRCRGLAGGRQVVADGWIDDILTRGDPDAWAGSEYESMLPHGGRYRSQWYLADARGSRFMGAGLHGQWIWGDRDRGVVVAMMASHPEAGSSATGNDRINLACFAAVAAALTGSPG